MSRCSDLHYPRFCFMRLTDGSWVSLNEDFADVCQGFSFLIFAEQPRSQAAHPQSGPGVLQ